MAADLPALGRGARKWCNTVERCIEKIRAKAVLEEELMPQLVEFYCLRSSGLPADAIGFPRVTGFLRQHLGHLAEEPSPETHGSVRSALGVAVGDTCYVVVPRDQNGGSSE
jgi:hypothetical protein